MVGSDSGENPAFHCVVPDHQGILFHAKYLRTKGKFSWRKYGRIPGARQTVFSIVSLVFHQRAACRTAEQSAGLRKRGERDANSIYPVFFVFSSWFAWMIICVVSWRCEKKEESEDLSAFQEFTIVTLIAVASMVSILGISWFIRAILG